MTKQISLIGTELDCTFRTIEHGQISRLDDVFNQTTTPRPNTHQDKKNGLPKMLPSFLLGNLINLPKIYKTLGLNINNVLLSRESVISHKTLRVGDVVNIRTFLRDAYEQQASSNPIGFIILESVGVHNTDLVFYCERVIAIRGGFQRGRNS